MARMNKQQAAVQGANDVISFMGTLKGLRSAINDFVTRYNSEGYSTTWSKLVTAVNSADGVPGLIDTTAGSGTVSVVTGSATITFSASQSALAGKYLVVTGDASNGYYLIVSGATTSWVLATPYGGLTAPTASWGTANPNVANPILIGGINRSQAALVAGVVLMQQLQNLFTNAAVTTGNYGQNIDDLVN